MASKKPTRSQKKAKASSSSRLRPMRLHSPDLTGPPAAKKQKTKPLSSIARPPVFDLTGGQPDGKGSKGKGKATERDSVGQESLAISDDRLWVDKYQPETEEDLAVHKRKVQDLRQWLLEAFTGGPSGKLRKYRRILALTGPAGTAKTATVRVLSRELGFEVLEWRNSMDERFSRDDEDGYEAGDHMEYEGLADKFSTFLGRASSCHSIFSPPVHPPSSQNWPSQASQSSQSSRAPAQSQSQPYSSTPTSSATSTSTTDVSSTKRQIILLEDLPNILHHGTQDTFHAALETFVSLPASSAAPLVLIISDTGIRGEDSENDVGGWRRQREAIDVRSVLPPTLLNSPYVTQIRFNPIAPTLMRPALQSLFDTHFRSAQGTPPSKDVLNLIVDSSNGDIRSAVMALQFACIADTNVGGKSAKGSKMKGQQARVIMEAVTRREQSLALFHLLGKVLYNKRKGDPPNASASAKDKQRDRELDAQLKDPPRLPLHLQEHERRTSRVDVEMLYADSPIDASLLSLYIHQNYTQYCNTVEECDAEADWLSWIDSSGGESWHQANPHHFHLLALSTLHSLPSPVVRRSQTPYKPAFFEALQREREAGDGLRDVQIWLQHDEERGAGSWSKRDIALELGAVLKARHLSGVGSSSVPATHRFFSRLDFGEDLRASAQLADDGDVPQDSVPDEDDGGPGNASRSDVEEDASGGGGWLEGDDIEEF